MDAYSHSVDSDSDNCDSLNDKLVNYVDEVQKIQNFLGKQRASNDDDVGIEKNEFEGKLVLTFNSKIIGFSSSDEEKGKQESARESPRKIDAPPMLLPNSANRKSAMKASSEKDGESRRKLRVTWAPDVYDPPPIQSELILSRDSMQQKAPKKEKRSGKKGQKGKEFSRVGSASKESSRASGKDKKKKKQHRRAAASSKHYDIFGDGDNDDMRSFSSGVLDSTSECSSKASSQWSSSSDKKKRNGGMGVNFRRYDLPPSDSDEDDEEAEDVEACSPDPHRSSN